MVTDWAKESQEESRIEHYSCRLRELFASGKLREGKFMMDLMHCATRNLMVFCKN